MQTLHELSLFDPVRVRAGPGVAGRDTRHGRCRGALREKTFFPQHGEGAAGRGG